MTETETSENPHVFEVGRFYKVQINPSYSKPGVKIPALCVRKLKRKIQFEYLERGLDGTVSKCGLTRWFYTDANGNEIARSSDIWSCINNTEASEVAEKPSIWDEVK